jgi:uncharacterized protein DUF6176
VAVEIVFRERDDNGDWLGWVMIQGAGGASIRNSPFEIDLDHAAFAGRVKLPNRPEAEPLLLLLAEPVGDAVLRWALPD